MKFEDAVREIEGAYERLGHAMGWRFLNVSKKVFVRNPPIALITANPGGDHQPADHGIASCENGCAYLVERWKGRPPGQENLQRQVQMLFSTLAQLSGSGDPGNRLMERSLVAYYIPFRSPRFVALHRRAESVAFAKALWTTVLPTMSPSLIVTIDRCAFEGMAAITSSLGTMVHEAKYPTGWGGTTADLKRYRLAKGHRAIVRLPHLSQFKLFSRTACLPFVQAILRAALAPE